MKNLCFVSYDFTKKGGAERATAKLVNELVKTSRVTLVSVFNGYKSRAYEVDQHVELINILGSSGSITKNIFRITRKICSIIKERNIDIIIAVDVATAAFSVLASKMTGRKLVMCDRSSCYNASLYANISVRFYAWLGIHFSDKYQVMTEDGKTGCIEKYRINRDKIIVIPNWIDEKAVSDCDYRYSNHKIISVGRATPEKNYETLIRVAAKIMPCSQEWEWHIWGDFNSDYGEKLLSMIHDKNLDQFLIHKGTTDDIYARYREYSFFVLTSQFEGMPNVILEAQGSKLPVISFDCKTGPSELIVDGRNGYLVKLNDVDTMCERIMDLMSDQNLAEQLAVQSSLNYDRYSKEKILEKWNELIGGMV